MLLLSEINKAFRADPVVKQVLGRGPDPDPREIYDAMQRMFARFPILREFWNDRCYGKYLFCKADFTPEFWKNPSLSFANALRDDARELGRSARGSLSAYSKKALLKWVHANGHMANFDPSTVDELKWAEGLRPDHPLKLYRGLLFAKWQFGTDERALNHPKNANIWLDALKHGHTSLMLDYKLPSSWSDEKSVADRFATKSAATSEYSAMINWIHNSKKFIDKELGLIISATIQPEDILCDVNKIDLGHLTHGNEGEFIVRPGARLQVQIEHIYLPTGEISVDKFGEFMNYIASKAA
jgi:hypothetical protein